MHASHVDTRSYKKFGSIWRMSKKVLPDGPFAPTRTASAVIGQILVIFRSTPNFASRWACPSQCPTQSFNAFGHRTHVASCPGSVLGFFPLENPIKCIQCRKWLKIDMDAFDGDANVWKKFECVSWIWIGEPVAHVPYRHSKTVVIAHGVRDCMIEKKEKFASMCAWPK